MMIAILSRSTRLVAAIILVATTGCSDVAVPFMHTLDTGDTGGTDSGVELDTDSDGSDAGAAAPWPETSWGSYYLEGGLPIGIPAMYFGSFVNLELEPGSLRITDLWCDGSEATEEHAISVEDGVVHVRPQRDQTHVIWNGSSIAKEILIRPGADCTELEMEFIDPVRPEGSFAVPWTWRRGALYINDTCGVGDDVWGADWSPDVPTECEAPG